MGKLLSKRNPRKIQFFGGPKDGEIQLNVIELATTVFFEEFDSSTKVGSFEGERSFNLHKYQLELKPDGELIYMYKGLS